MAKSVSLAIDRYDRHFPFFDGTVTTDNGLELNVLQVGETTALRDGAHRHKRMLQDGEFDAAEVSLSSYVMATARGLPFTAIPVFPRRLFSQTQIYVNDRTGITEPSQLNGKKIGLQSFQTTLAVLAKGDVAAEYGVDLTSIRWVVRAGETIAFEPPSGWQIDYVPLETDLGTLLANEDIEALFLSRVPSSFDGKTVRRLFADPEKACADYFRKNGYFPIMHVVAIRDEIAADLPDLPQQLFRMFVSAKAIADSYRDDPGWSQLAWGRLALDRQNTILGGDPWPIGFVSNRDNLNRFIGYSHNQGLIDSAFTAEELFHESVLET